MLLSVRIKRSSSPFAGGHRSVTRRWLNPTFCANSLNSLLLNGGSLSEHTVSGTTNSVKILLRRGITAFYDTEVTTSATGYLE